MAKHRELTTDLEIAYHLRQIGSLEGHDTVLTYGGNVYLLHDDGNVYMNGRFLSASRSDVGKKRKPYRNRSKAYEDHLVSDFNYDPGGDDSPDCGPSG